MISSFEALVVFLLFLPGFLSQRIIEVLTPKRSRDNFVRFIDAVVLSLLVYSTYLLIATNWFDLPILPVSAESIPTIDISSFNFININEGSVVAILSFSVIWGVLIGHGLEQGWIYWLLRGEYMEQPSYDEKGIWANCKRMLNKVLSFTRGSGKSSVWQEVFSDPKSNLVEVRLRDGSKVYGYCTHYSDEPGEQELLIERPPNSAFEGEEEKPIKNVLVAKKGGRPKKIPASAILITSKMDIEKIVFLDGLLLE